MSEKLIHFSEDRLIMYKSFVLKPQIDSSMPTFDSEPKIYKQNIFLIFFSFAIFCIKNVHNN
jgi:hypothetical protein